MRVVRIEILPWNTSDMLCARSNRSSMIYLLLRGNRALSAPNVKDEPRLRPAGRLLRSRHDGRGRWLWRLVGPHFFDTMRHWTFDITAVRIALL